jgi:hypothetical protein
MTEISTAAKRERPLYDWISRSGEKLVRFFVRQFTPPPGPGQIIFDIVFGILLPLTILIIDPILLKTGWPWQTTGTELVLLDRIRVLLYSLIGTGFAALLFSIVIGNRAPKISAGLVGIFALGANLSFWVGFFLLTLTTPMMAVFIIEIGEIDSSISQSDLEILLIILAAFFSGLAMIPITFVYARNSLRAFIQSIHALKWHQILLALLIGGMILLALPAGLQFGSGWLVNRMIARLIADTEGQDNAAIQIMQAAVWCRDYCYEDLARAYMDADSAEEKERLSAIYQAITGENLKSDLWIIQD